MSGDEIRTLKQITANQTRTIGLLNKKIEELKAKQKKYIRPLLGYQKVLSGGLAGQAFTDYECLNCEQVQTHPNTNTPLFCGSCTEVLIQEFRKN